MLCRIMLTINLGSRYADVQRTIISISQCLKLFIIKSWIRREEMLLIPETWKKVNISIRKLKRVNKESYVPCNWQRHLIRLIGNLFISESCYHFRYLRFVGIFYYNLSQIHCVNKKHFMTSEGSRTVWFWFSSFCVKHVVNINYSKISKLGRIK